MDQAKLIDGAAVAVALSAARRYALGAPWEASLWCAAGGAAAAMSDQIEKSASGVLPGAVGMGSLMVTGMTGLSFGQQVAALAGGLALEASADGLQLSDLYEMSSLGRIAIGVVAAGVGMTVARYVGGSKASKASFK